MKKRNCLVYILIFTLMLCGCSVVSKKNDASHLTVYLWDNTLSKSLVSYIESKLPDEDIEFIYGNNTVDLYEYLEKHNDLPDIITTRRFSQSDSIPLKSHLLDFSSYDEVSKYYPYALQYYTDDVGSVQWLPICGIPETMIVNKTLFDEYNIAVPKNYAELVKESQILYENGIKPYTSELKMDWATHSFLQGAAIDQFASVEGLEWRNIAENTTKRTTFDTTLWQSIFSQVNTFIQDMHMDEEDIDCDLDTARNRFVNRQAGMFRATPVVMKQLQQTMDDELVRIPYFSQTSDESWIYTYPSINVALNSDLQNDKDKLDVAMRVLDCMLSKKGQNFIAGGQGTISYNANVPSNLDGMTGIEDEVRKNAFYIRYASNNSFKASLDTVQGLISGSMDVDQADSLFQKEINKPKQKEKTVLTFHSQYDLSMDKKGGRPAASSILTTIRKDLKLDVALSSYVYYASSIYVGKYTENELNLMITHNDDSRIYMATMTGKQIQNVLDQYIKENVNTAYKMPIASGFQYETKEGVLKSTSLKKRKKYTILLTEDMIKYCSNIFVQKTDSTLSDQWVKTILKEKDSAKPEEYIEME